MFPFRKFNYVGGNAIGIFVIIAIFWRGQAIAPNKIIALEIRFQGFVEFFQRVFLSS